MTAYTREQLEALASAQRGGRNEQEHSQIRNVPACTHVPDFRVDIRREILDAVSGAGRAMTRAEIAATVGRRKTTWLNERIESLVADGLLTRDQSYWKNGVVMYYYSIGRERAFS